jgi:hypothetical protein
MSQKIEKDLPPFLKLQSRYDFFPIEIKRSYFRISMNKGKIIICTLMLAQKR